MMKKRIAEFIRESRLKKNLTQAQVAKFIGISTQQYQKYESGKNGFSTDRLMQLMQVLDFDVYSLFIEEAFKESKKSYQTFSPSSGQHEDQILFYFSQIQSRQVREKAVTMMKIILDEERSSLEKTED